MGNRLGLCAVETVPRGASQLALEGPRSFFGARRGSRTHHSIGYEPSARPPCCTGNHFLLHTPLPSVVQRSAACPSARSPRCDRESLRGVIALLFLPNAGHVSVFHPALPATLGRPRCQRVLGLVSKNVLSFPSGGATRSETPVGVDRGSTDGAPLATSVPGKVG